MGIGVTRSYHGALFSRIVIAGLWMPTPRM
jgi:hypothetical protein